MWSLKEMETNDSAVDSISKLTLLDDISEDYSTKNSFKHLECPFSWPECYEKINEMDWVHHLQYKRSTFNCNDWRFYSLNVLLSFMYGYKKDETNAFEALQLCENLIDRKADETFFKDIKEGMQHVITASRCYIYFENGKPEKAKEIASATTPFKDLNKPSQAAVWATKAYMLTEYGYEGKVKALECMELAMELDRDEDGKRKGAWYYLAGKIRGQIRRIRSYNEMPSKKELQLLERAVKNDSFPVHMAVLGDAYRETSKILLKTPFPNRSLSVKLCSTAVTMYKRAINDKELNVSVLKRVGAGLTKLPGKFRDLKLAEETLKTALNLAPENSAVLLTLGNLEIFHKKNPYAALDYYEKSYNNGNEFAAIMMIKVRYRLNNAYNPLDDINKYIKDMSEEVKLGSKMKSQGLIILLLLKGEYYLLIKKDLLSAAREWNEAIKIAPDSSYFLDYVCNLADIRDSMNIYMVLQKEIENTLKVKEFKDDDEAFLKKVMKECQEKSCNQVFPE